MGAHSSSLGRIYRGNSYRSLIMVHNSGTIKMLPHRGMNEKNLRFWHVKTSREPAEYVVSEDAAEIILAQVVSEMFNIYKHESFQIL